MKGLAAVLVVLIGTTSFTYAGDASSRETKQVAQEREKNEDDRLKLLFSSEIYNAPSHSVGALYRYEAQAASKEKKKSLTKMLAGAGLAGVGLFLVATSPESVTMTVVLSERRVCTPGLIVPMAPCRSVTLLGVEESTQINNGKLYGGIGLAAAGAVLGWLGAKDRSSPSVGHTFPSSHGTRGRVVIGIGVRTQAAYQLSW